MVAPKDPGIVDLPVEIVQHIVREVEFESHLAFALSCKHLHSCTQQLLQRHQEAFTKCRIVSDLQPSTIPKLIRAALCNPNENFALELWHIRKVEIWNDRESWEDWRPIALSRPSWVKELMDNDWRFVTPARPSWIGRFLVGGGELEDGWQTVSAGYFDQTVDPEEWNYAPHEVRKYMLTAADMLYYSADEVEEMQAQLQAGNDGPLKILFLALCPRLRAIRVVHSPKSHGGDSTFLRILSNVGQRFSATGTYWPPGLKHLPTISIGVPSNTWLDDLPELGSDYLEDHEGVSSTMILGSLSCFPNLHDLYLRHDGGDKDYDYDVHFPPEQTAPLKHVRFEGKPNVASDMLRLFFEALHAPETLTLQGNGCWDDFNDTLEVAFEDKNDYQSLVVYNMRETNGYRCDTYQMEDIDLKSTCPKHLCGNVYDFFTMAYINDPSVGNGGYSTIEEWTGREEHSMRELTKAFPEFLDVLILGSGDSDSWNEKEADIIEACLIHLIKSDRCQGLRLLVIEATVYEQGLVLYPEGKEPRPVQNFGQRLIEMGKEAGVQVLVRYNAKGEESPPLSLEWGLPRCPDAGDLESISSSRRSMDEKWGIDPFTGRLRASRVLIEPPTSSIQEGNLAE